MRSTTLLAVVAGGVTAVNAVAQGFNYGSTQTDGSIKDQAAFESEFKTAKSLVGTSGFTSARLYTMIQGGTQNTPITAIPAAIAQQTNLLLGLWASGGQAGFDNEIAALKSAIESYGTAFTSLVNGISVGSEDLYRDSELGQLAKAGYGVGPDVVVSYIKQLRAALVGTPLSGASIGHVDTFNLWTNSSNKAVIDNVDWLGMDAYPYFQNTQANSIENAAALFSEAYAETTAVAGGKPVIITESGWPVSGPNQGQAVASLANAKTYWDQVGCPRFGKVDTYWFTLQDAYPVTPSPSFGIVGSTLSTTPLYDLSCSAVSSSSSASASSSTSASAASSIASSAASVATSSLATGGSGLSPTQGNGVGSSVLSIATSATSSSAAGSGTATATVIASSAAGSSSGNGTSIVATGTGAGSSVPTTVATSTQTGGAGSGGSSTTTSAQSTFTGAAAAVSGSMLGAVGAIFAMVAAL